MASYNYIEQGGYKLLIYKMSEEDQIDSMAVGQLADSSSIIPGVLPISQSEIDSVVQFQVNVTGMVSLEELFKNPVSPKLLLKIYKQIASSLKEADDYMLDYNVFVLDEKYVYFSMNDQKVYLVALPVIHDTQSPENFLKNLLLQDFDETEDSKLITNLSRVFYSMGSFSITEFCEKLEQIKVSDSRGNRFTQSTERTNDFGRSRSDDISGERTSYKGTNEKSSAYEGQERTERFEIPPVNNRNNNLERTGQQIPKSPYSQNSGFSQEKGVSDVNLPFPEDFPKKETTEKKKKKLFSFLFAKKEKDPDKKKKLKNGKKDGSGVSKHGFAIPGQDEKNIERKDINAETKGFKKPYGIGQQKVKNDVVYQNPVQNFGETIVEDNLYEWDIDTFGKTVVEVEDEIYPQVYLKLVDDKGYPVPEMIQITLKDGYASIGRFDKTGQPCADFNFDLSLTFISREHMQFLFNEDHVELVDKNSVNGTLLNGERISSGLGYPIRKGDIIEISVKTRLSYCVERISNV